MKQPPSYFELPSKNEKKLSISQTSDRKKDDTYDRKRKYYDLNNTYYDDDRRTSSDSHRETKRTRVDNSKVGKKSENVNEYSPLHKNDNSYRPYKNDNPISTREVRSTDYKRQYEEESYRYNKKPRSYDMEMSKSKTSYNNNSENNSKFNNIYIPKYKIKNCKALKEYNSVWEEVKKQYSPEIFFKDASMKTISLTVNAFSKCDRNYINKLSFYEDLKLYLNVLIKREMNAQQIAMLANGFSKSEDVKQFKYFWEDISSFYRHPINIKDLNIQHSSIIFYSMRRVVRTNIKVKELYSYAISHITSLLSDNSSKENALSLYMLFACYSSSVSYFKGKNRENIYNIGERLAAYLKLFINDLDLERLNLNNFINMEGGKLMEL